MNRHKEVCGVWIMLLIGTWAYCQELNPSQNIQTPFDLCEIIERVSHHPIREGDCIVIKDQIYVAYFDENGVVLKAREPKPEAEDLVIRIHGVPEIKNGKVVYQTPFGEISFEGRNNGLRCEQEDIWGIEYELDYAGNVAKLCDNTSPSLILCEASEESDSAVNNILETDGGPTQPMYTTAYLIDTNVIYTLPTPNNQIFPAVASDGTNYLVVWHDSRSASSLNGYFDIYGTRVSQSGVVLDPAGIAISTTIHDQGYASVAFDGTNYLVVWDEWVSGSHIYGSRVSQAGIVLDTSAIDIAIAGNDQLRPSVAFDGTNYLVVWMDYRSGPPGDVYGARVSQDATVLDTLGIAISTAASYQYYPQVAYVGTKYLVVWQDYRNGTYDVYGTCVSQAGAVLNPSGIAISTAVNDQSSPSVTGGDTDFMVVWSDNRSGYDIYGSRVNQNGSVLDPNGIAISTAVNAQGAPAVAFDGTSYLVVWQDDRSPSGEDIYGARVTQLGSVLEPAGIAICTAMGSQLYPSIAFAGSSYLVAWMGDHVIPNDYDLLGARVSQTGVVLDPSGIIISSAFSRQESPAVAFDGTNYLVVWSDNRNSYHPDLYGCRVSQAGLILDPTGFAISTATYDQKFPAVAFDGTYYLVVWQDHRSSGANYPDIYGSLVSQMGLVLNPPGIPISIADYHQETPAIAFDGTNYLVVWNDLRNGTNYDIYGSRVSQGGSVLNPSGIAISTATNDQMYPAVAFGGTDYLVGWTDYRTGSWDIYGSRINQAGSVLDPSGITISNAGNSQRWPAIAFDGANYLVVWHDSRNGTYYDIYGSRVSQGGSVLNPSGIAISTAEDFQIYPSIAFDGLNYLVLWEDSRNGIDNFDIYGAKLNTAGLVINTFAASTQPGNQNAPTLAHGLGNKFLTIYSGWTAYINNHPAMIPRIWCRFYPFSTAEEVND